MKLTKDFCHLRSSYTLACVPSYVCSYAEADDVHSTGIHVSFDQRLGYPLSQQNGHHKGVLYSGLIASHFGRYLPVHHDHGPVDSAQVSCKWRPYYLTEKYKKHEQIFFEATELGVEIALGGFHT